MIAPETVFLCADTASGRKALVGRGRRRDPFVLASRRGGGGRRRNDRSFRATAARAAFSKFRWQKLWTFVHRYRRMSARPLSVSSFPMG
jgi:hypothetical protein